VTYDVHAHCLPQAVVDLLRVEGHVFGIDLLPGDKGDVARIAGRVEAGPLRPELIDFERRLATMDATGIDVQVLASWIDLTAYALEPERGTRYARRFNQLLAEEAARAPGRFRALATVPLQSPVNAAEELVYAVTELGMVGVEIATTVDGVDLDQARLDPFWAAAEELSCLVLIHPYAPLAGVDLSRYFLDNLVGRPAESTVTIAYLLMSGLFDRYPDLKVVLCHGGGFLPFQLGRLERGFRAVPGRVAVDAIRPPAEVARQLYYDTVLHSPQALRFLIDLVGPEHVLLGSDYPFEMGDPDPLQTLQAVPGLTEAEFEAVTSGTFESLCFGAQEAGHRPLSSRQK
jgi:aminocarboxymuconate-semialdehyde decarboxylase